MRKPLPGNKISLTDLIALDELQEMQDSFAEVASVAIRVVDPKGNNITQMSSPPSLCAEILNDPAIKDRVCSGCRPTFLGGEGIVDDDLSFECMPGLKNYLLPLKVSSSSDSSLILGYFIIGPVIFMKRRTREEYKDIAEKLGVDLDQLWSLMLELRVFSYKGVRSLLDMIDNLVSRILNLAYAKEAMRKKISRRIFSRPVSKLLEDPGREDEFLELFLDLVIESTRGNIGSVMLFDRYKRQLVIKASHGLSEEVVRKTVVKRGEGVSGLAAETKKPFLINEGKADKTIAERLKRPNLLSSVIAPIKCHDDVYGVVNVSSDRDNAVKFDDSTLTFLTKAAGLAGVALERIQ